MKNIAILMLLVFASCGNKKNDSVETNQSAQTASVQLGKTLFESTGSCVACHQPKQKVIGPSITEISKIYREKDGKIVSFLREEADPIVDPSQYEIMKTNFVITKKMSDTELKSIEMYIYTYSE